MFAIHNYQEERRDCMETGGPKLFHGLEKVYSRGLCARNLVESFAVGLETVRSVGDVTFHMAYVALSIFKVLRSA